MFEKLRKESLLSCLSEKEWSSFIALTHFHKKAYNKGEIIYLEEEACYSMDFILSGSVYVKRHDEEGRTLMIERFKSGDILGGNLLFSSDAFYPMTVISESDCELVSLNKTTVLSWCQSNQFFLERYLTEISDKSKFLIKTIVKLSTGTLREKLMTYFNAHVVNGMVTLDVTKKELSERYGVARTSLSRELKRMENDGLIKIINRDQFIIK